MIIDYRRHITWVIFVAYVLLQSRHHEDHAGQADSELHTCVRLKLPRIILEIYRQLIHFVSTDLTVLRA